MKTLVMKFGGASVATPGSFSQIADIILQRKNEYPHIAIVVSAMGDTTDQLIELAKSVHPTPPRREFDMLVTVGERISISLLAMALSKKNQEAVSFTGSQSGIITCESHCDAKILDVRPSRLIPILQEGKIIIVAGFQGVSQNREITTLGRGGSDTSAVALALALNADKVEFYKDVSGIYVEDPKKNSEAKLCPKLTYDEVIHIVSSGSEILHERCIKLAKANGLPMQVRSFKEFGKNESAGTMIADHSIPRNKVPLYESDTQTASKMGF